MLYCQGTCLDLDTGLVLVMNLNFVNSGSSQPFVHLEATNSLINIVVRFCTLYSLALALVVALMCCCADLC